MRMLAIKDFLYWTVPINLTHRTLLTKLSRMSFYFPFYSCYFSSSTSYFIPFENLETRFRNIQGYFTPWEPTRNFPVSFEKMQLPDPSMTFLENILALFCAEKQTGEKIATEKI